MSEKNFMAYGDAESVFTGYANRIKQSPTTFVGTRAQWDALSLSQKAEYTLVDITDDEFSPNNFVDWESYSILGAKNLLPVTMASQVLSGVTFTVDSASGIIGVSGNNSGTPFSDVIGTTLLKPGTYKVTTGQATELNAQIGIAVTNASSETILARSWNGTEVFTISSDTQVNFHIEVNVTGTITSTTIYPTCKLDSIKDESYVPYAMTNRELSSQIQAYTNIVNITDKFTKPSTTLSFEAYKAGHFVYVLTTFKPTAIGFAHIATFNDPNLDPINIMYSHGVDSNGKASNNWARAQTGAIEGFVYEQADLPTYFTEFSLIYLCRG